MTDNKLTDSEIIKALECFALDKDFDDSQCIGCVFEHQFCTANMSVDIAKPSLDLINRQKAEIKRLQKEIEKLEYHLDCECSMSADVGSMLIGEEKAKAEAIKEFAERLIADLALLVKHEDEFRQSVILGVIHTIDAKKKELVGDGDE